ncbi:MAG TPA: polysialyltransferase family glycosyltransferase, partial [Propionibacteriaceae bacterium]
MTTQIFVASTAYGLATVAAALDEGLFPAADRRLLLLTNNAAMPEVTAAVTDVAGVDTLLDRFDATIDYNDTIAPQHPSAWAPRSAELPLWERSLRALWGLGDDTVHLVLESIQASPALALARVFADARIDVYADGLMSYGPTRTALPDDVGWRIERLLHLDLVPGLVPMLLADWQVPPTVVSTDRFRAVIASMSPAHTEPQEQVVLVLGQYLAAADLLSETEEIRLYRELIVRAGRSTQRRVVFKPHPSAPLNQQAALRSAAAEAGVDLEITTELELAEAWFARGQV